MNTLIYKANILVEALPYIQTLRGKTVVIKYGGNAMMDREIIQTIMQDITLLKYVGVNPVVVHGGGPKIDETLKTMEIESEFYKGLRITDHKAMDAVQMILAGSINKDIVALLNSLGSKAIGLCGKDASLIEAKKKVSPDNVDLGYVGEIIKINSRIIDILTEDEYIPVIAPIGTDQDGQSYNINADTAAGEIAAALKAEKLIFLTDIDGIYVDPEDENSLASVISIPEIYDLIHKGVITGGMIPKSLGCIKAIEQGVNRTHILNGTIPHPILLEIFTDKGIGTMVAKGGINSGL